MADNENEILLQQLDKAKVSDDRFASNNAGYIRSPHLEHLKFYSLNLWLDLVYKLFLPVFMIAAAIFTVMDLREMLLPFLTADNEGNFLEIPSEQFTIIIIFVITKGILVLSLLSAVLYFASHKILYKIT